MASRNYKSMTEEELRSLAHDNTVNWHNYDNKTEEGRAAQDRLHQDNVDIYAEIDSRTGGTHSFSDGLWDETPGNKYTSDYPQIVQRLTDEAKSIAATPAPTYQSNYAAEIAPYQEEIRALMNQTAPTYQSGYVDAVAPIQERINGMIGQTGPAAYESQYANDIQAAAQAILSRDPFSYDPQTDPMYSQYRKQYTREGQRAAADVMGQYAAMTGGMPSTAAVAASQQAGDLYAAKMADVLPQLYQQAYAMYQDQGNTMRDNLNMLRGLDADAYGRYQDDVDRFNANRNFDYNALRGQISDAQAAEELAYRRYLGELDQFNANRNFNYDALRSQISDAQYGEERAYNQYLNELQQYNADRDFNYGRVRDQITDAYNADTTQYQRYLDELENARYEDETAYNRAWNSEERDYQRMLDALSNQATLAQLGGQIGDYSGYEALGFTPDAEAMLRMQLAGAGRTAPVGSGSSGGSSRSSSSKSSSEKPTLTVAQVEKAIKEGRVTQKVLDAYEYYYGEPYQSKDYDALLATERADEADKLNADNYGISDRILDEFKQFKHGGGTEAQAAALIERWIAAGKITPGQGDVLAEYYYR